MPTTLIRTAAVALALLACAPPCRAADGDEHLYMGNPSGADKGYTRRRIRLP